MLGGRQGRHRRAVVALVAGLLAPFVVPEVAEPASMPASDLCGEQDTPETGIPGDIPLPDQQSGRARLGYNCGLAVVGHSSLGNRGGNANMAWSQDCAYIAGDGVAVVDVSDPRRPRHVRTLHTPGSETTVETLHAVDAPDRHILVTGRYGLGGADGDGPAVAPVDIWDTSDCANPRLLSEVAFPGNVHNLTLTADGKRIWSTLPLRAADISDPRHPRVLPRIEPQLAASGATELAYAHEAWPSPDGTRLYIGNQGTPEYEQMLVIDTTGWPARPAKVLGSAPVPGHSIRPMTIDGTPFLLMSDESILNPTGKGCLPDRLTPFGGAARPKLVDLTHETRPLVRSTLTLAISDPIHCVDQVLSGVNASSHYHDVDDPDDTTFAMVSTWNSGLRIYDVRDPSHPREVAYFNPGTIASGSAVAPIPGVGPLVDAVTGQGLDRTWAHVRYRPDTGHVWLTTAAGGLYVLELEPQVRAALDLPARTPVHPDGAPAKPRGIVQDLAPARTLRAVLAPAYCALSTAGVL